VLDAAAQRRKAIAATVILRAGLFLLAASQFDYRALAAGPARSGRLCLMRDHHDKQRLWPR
jgi:hypothetical protein